MASINHATEKKPRNKLGYLIQIIGVNNSPSVRFSAPIRVLNSSELDSIEKREHVKVISKPV